MAKNTSSSAFRKIDVDEYNEDNYKDDELSTNQLTINEAEINSLLMQGKVGEALGNCLRNAPLSSKSQDVKDSALSTTLRVLTTIKQSQMEEALTNLDPDSIDTLMKYIYRGFETPNEGSSGHLLAWHEKVFSIGGIGSITRVLTDRKRV